MNNKATTYAIVFLGIAIVISAFIVRPAKEGGIFGGNIGSQYLRYTNSTNATTTDSALIDPSTGLSTLTQVASTSPLYLGTRDFNPLASSTILVLDKIEDVSKISLLVQVNASTTGATVTISPKVSDDGIDWFNMNSGITYQPVTTSSGSLTNQLLGGSGAGTNSTSTVVFQTWNVGMNRGQMIIGVPIAKYMRFDVASNASTSIWMQAAELINQSH